MLLSKIGKIAIPKTSLARIAFAGLGKIVDHTSKQLKMSLNSEQTASLLSFAEKIVSEVGQGISDHFRNRSFSVLDKADGSPVTEADREAEAFLRNRIERKFPQDGIIGEEFGEKKGESDFVWVIDPIDGTQSFVHGVPLFGTLLGVLYRGKPVIGVINQPILGRMVSGDNRTARMNGQPVSVREPRCLSEATLLLTDPGDPLLLAGGERYLGLLDKAGFVRSWGDCFGYLSLTMGLADVMIDPVLNPWDLLPLLPILKGAGASVSDFAGGAAERGNSLVASSCPALHQEVLRVLNG